MLRSTHWKVCTKPCYESSKRFSTRTCRFYSTHNELKITFEEYAKRNNILTPKDWYQMNLSGLDEQVHDIVKQKFRGSLYRALSTIFPESSWHPWKFKQAVPRNYWADPSNQLKFFEDLGKQIGVQTLDDWYEKLSKNLIREHGGQAILGYHQQSPLAALTSSYPNHNWLPWKFNCVPVGFWSQRDNHREYLDWLGRELGIQHLDEWYNKLSQKVFRDNYGRGLLNIYHGSPVAAITTIYPQHPWDHSKFSHAPHKYWHDPANQRKFFEDLGHSIGINSLDDWYEKLSYHLLAQHGASGLLHLHRMSPTAALMASFPEHNWIPWKFKVKSSDTWESKDNVSKYVAYLSEKLAIQTLDDWYRVDLPHIKQLGGTTLISRYGGLYNLLKEVYPNHPWDRRTFQQKGKKAQRWLAVTLKKMFPDEEIYEDYMHPRVMLPSSNRAMQLDVFIPSKSLAFEYQGVQHYQEVGVFNAARTYQQRDEEKRTLCASNNIKLIEVPYWWNRTQQSLQEMISTSTSSK